MAERHARAPFRLDVVADVICPWCYIGRRRLQAALALLAGEDPAFVVRWRPYELNPDMSEVGLDRRSYRTAKFGSWERSQARNAQVAAAAASEGLVVRHELMTRTPNTLAAHMLIQAAYELGGAELQDRVVEAVFIAYFTEGRDIGARDVLVEIATAAELDRERIAALLVDGAYGQQVQVEAANARALGIDGVPSFLLEGRYLFAGAQPSATMAHELRAAATLAGQRSHGAGGRGRTSDTGGVNDKIRHIDNTALRLQMVADCCADLLGL